MRHIPFEAFIWVRCVLVHSQIAGCRRAGQVRPHRTAPRRGERGATITPAGLMTGGGPPKRTGGVRVYPAFMAVPCNICPRVGCLGGPGRGKAVGGDHSAACC
jgi:hypothetical protein